MRMWIGLPRLAAIGFIASLATTAMGQDSGTAANISPMQPWYPERGPVKTFEPSAISASDVALTLPNKLAVTPTGLTTIISLNGDGWKCSGLENAATPFPADADEDKGFAAGNFDDSKWDAIQVPLNWYVKYPKALRKDAAYVKGWYRRTLQLGPESAGKRVLLHFDVIGYQATLFVNGKLAGSHHGDFTPWDIDITEHVSAASPNMIAIKVLSDLSPNFGAGSKATHAYGSLWSIGNVKGGIWQDASLRIEQPLRFSRILIAPDLASSSLRVDYTIRNDTGKDAELELFATVTSAMRTDAGALVANLSLGKAHLKPGDTEATAVVPLKNPRLWTLESPYLHHLTLALSDGTAVAAAKSERFGFREFKVVGKQFLLNNAPIYLFGENLPAVNFGGNGAKADEERAAIADKIIRFKSLGYNIIRNPHQPIIPVALEVADEIGFMFFDEWAWSFLGSIDKVAFEKNNLEEFAEWVHRDYNHPSVVMWSCGNEVHYDADDVFEQMNKQVALLRKLDASKRPISTFSGAAFGYGKRKLDTDVIDLHDYLGLGTSAWTYWEDNFNKVYKQVLDIYGTDGVLDKPFIIWECVGFSWGGKPDPAFKPDNIELYAKYATSQTSWGDPQGIGFAGSIGLAAALDQARGNPYGQAIVGRRILEYIRQDVRVQGFAPWFHGFNLTAATLWNQPVFCSLRGPGAIPLKNVFGGRTYEQTFMLINSSASPIKDAMIQITLAAPDNSEQPLTTLKIAETSPFGVSSATVSLAMPDTPAACWRQIRVTVTSGGQTISRNFYNVFLQNNAILKQAITTSKKVAVFTGAEGVDTEATAAILTQLGITHTLINDINDLTSYEALVIPPLRSTQAPLSSSDAIAQIKQWIRDGGVLLMLERGFAGEIQLLDQLVGPAANTLVDLVIPSHPAFAGLRQENFDTWNNPNHGLAIRFGFSPFSRNALAARGPLLGFAQTYNAVSEGTLGKGRIFCSQLEAVGLWDADSAASTYLRNVFSYLLSDSSTPCGLVKPWSETRASLKVVPERMTTVDLRKAATSSFTDETDSDGKGGWTDQGSNDFRNIPLGKQVFRGVPFEIIDPAANEGKSCIVLKGAGRQSFPSEATGIPVGAKLCRLFFLHTSAWGGSNKKIGEYRIHYEDGSEEVVDIVDGKHIGDWWRCCDIPGALMAFTVPSPASESVGCFLMPWENPRPGVAITSIDFISTGVAVPALVAIAAEKAHPDPLIIDDLGGVNTRPWSVLTDVGGSDVSAGSKMTPTTAVLDRGNGAKALRVEMPAKSAGPGTSVTFQAFPKEQLAKLKNGNYDYLTFWLKAENSGTIEVILPKQDWKDSLAANIFLDPSSGWRKVRLNLREQMGLKNKKWALDELRGEFFIFNRFDSSPSETPAVFQIADVELE